VDSDSCSRCCLLDLPLFLAIVGGLTVVYVYVVMLYIRTSVPLKKAAGQSVSNVVAHTSETLSGLAVVRAFRMQERFLNENIQFQSRSTVVSFCIANLSLWLAFRVDIIGSLLVLTCRLLAVADASMEASIAGLIVSNSFISCSSVSCPERWERFTTICVQATTPAR
jgi:ABC-type multidrug transport system fused ATPase/permease subunit